MRVLMTLNIADAVRTVETVEVVEHDGGMAGDPIGIFVERRPVDADGQQGPAWEMLACSTAAIAMRTALDRAGWLEAVRGGNIVQASPFSVQGEAVV
jgi:hypothetical protein